MATAAIPHTTTSTSTSTATAAATAAKAGTSTSSATSSASTKTSSSTGTAAAATSGSSSAGSSALSQLSQLSQVIARQQALNSENRVVADTRVSNFSKTITKSAYSNRATASDIGTLIHKKTRLNAFGQLGAYDKADYLKFKLTSATSVTLGKLASADVRIQLMNKGGAVVADTDKDSGAAYKAYQEAQNGNLSLPAGEYVLKISRVAGVPVKKAENYGIQVASGKYGKDYTTTVKAPASTTGVANVKATLGSMVTSLLLGGLNTTSTNGKSS